ncbi:MAG: hypothetical protein LUC90_09135 [Lachnospiraceae bacterium]|nr:hypothetical protein [Lachnospiraceae bacterium]
MKKILYYGLLTIILVCIVLFATGIVALPTNEQSKNSILQENEGENISDSSLVDGADTSQAESSSAFVAMQTQDLPNTYTEEITDTNIIDAVVGKP